MTTNLRGSLSDTEKKIDDYLNASAFIQTDPTSSIYVVDIEPVEENQFDVTDFASASDFVYPSGFDIQEYLIERNRNVIGKHLRLMHFIANADIVG
jgi:hypothetical protein